MIGRIMLHKKTLLFAALSAALWGGATQAADAAVVASLKPVGFIASAIADGVTETEVLLPDGASEHDYSLRPSDVKRLQNADLVVWVGPEMEAYAKTGKQITRSEAGNDCAARRCETATDEKYSRR
ncbi:metal ABC transporter solute-binding protein, Zn/Mn family [Escherichia coli]